MLAVLGWLAKASIAVVKWVTTAAVLHPIALAIGGVALYGAGKLIGAQPWAGAQVLAGLLDWTGKTLLWTGAISYVGGRLLRWIAGRKVARLVATAWAYWWQIERSLPSTLKLVATDVLVPPWFASGMERLSRRFPF